MGLAGRRIRLRHSGGRCLSGSGWRQEGEVQGQGAAYNRDDLRRGDVHVWIAGQPFAFDVALGGVLSKSVEKGLAQLGQNLAEGGWRRR